ncbi:chaperonin 10-like protein [Mycena sp. CBHHK59/15]|nr:chaperonin 10-like protein [Mycena sp. CBHHK59/15]
MVHNSNTMTSGFTLPRTTRALVVEEFGAVDKSLKIKDVPTPTPAAGYAIIKVKAFGVNHAEMHMRRGEWAESMPIIGIEFAGIVVSSIADSVSPALAPGTPVVTLMDGLGRTINGSYTEYTEYIGRTINGSYTEYTEYTATPLSNVVPVPRATVDALGWARLAVLPETYATAWTCVFHNLDV